MSQYIGWRIIQINGQPISGVHGFRKVEAALPLTQDVLFLLQETRWLAEIREKVLPDFQMSIEDYEKSNKENLPADQAIAENYIETTAVAVRK